MVAAACAFRSSGGPSPTHREAGPSSFFFCSLLHEAMPVTEGRRYAFLPFLYDDAAAQIREQNLPFVE